MRVLTVRQPWAWAIVHGGKDVENRTRNIAGAYRGPVAIHVAHAMADAAAWSDPNVESALIAHDGASDWPLSIGHIIGVVDLVDVHPDCTEHVEGFGCTPTCSPWAMSGHQHLAFDNPRPLTTPIPAKGRLGLWHPSEDLAAAITAQMVGAA